MKEFSTSLRAEIRTGLSAEERRADIPDSTANTDSDNDSVADISAERPTKRVSFVILPPSSSNSTGSDATDPTELPTGRPIPPSRTHTESQQTEGDHTSDDDDVRTEITMNDQTLGEVGNNDNVEVQGTEEMTDIDEEPKIPSSEADDVVVLTSIEVDYLSGRTGLLSPEIGMEEAGFDSGEMSQTYLRTKHTDHCRRRRVHSTPSIVFRSHPIRQRGIRQIADRTRGDGSRRRRDQW